MEIPKLISFSVFFFSLLIPARTTAVKCTNAVCGKGQPVIRFPFRIKTRQPEWCGYGRGFDLTCDDAVNRTTVKLTFAGGDFTVEEIDYVAQEIWINDPNGCLPKRILTLDLSTTPFTSVYSQPFTFFNCQTWDSDPVHFQQLKYIPCLSGENGTVFATSSPRVVSYLSESCVVMKNVEVPVRWPFYERVPSSELSDDLWLTWRVPRCRRCERKGGRCGLKSNSTHEIICSDSPSPGLPRKARYAIAIGAGIPGSLCLFGLLCLLYSQIKSCIKRRRMSSGPGPDNPGPDLQLNVTISGLDEPTIKSYPKIVLGESKRLPKPNDVTCHICLSDYEPKDTLRTIPQCQHCFHVDCIDEWLKMNATCPVCRNSPEPMAAPPENQGSDSC